MIKCSGSRTRARRRLTSALEQEQLDDGDGHLSSSSALSSAFSAHAAEFVPPAVQLLPLLPPSVSHPLAELLLTVAQSPSAQDAQHVLAEALVLACGQPEGAGGGAEVALQLLSALLESSGAAASMAAHTLLAQPHLLDNLMHALASAPQSSSAAGTQILRLLAATVRHAHGEQQQALMAQSTGARCLHLVALLLARLAAPPQGGQQASTEEHQAEQAAACLTMLHALACSGCLASAATLQEAAQLSSPAGAAALDHLASALVSGLKPCLCASSASSSTPAAAQQLQLQAAHLLGALCCGGRTHPALQLGLVRHGLVSRPGWAQHCPLDWPPLRAAATLTCWLTSKLSLCSPPSQVDCLCEALHSTNQHLSHSKARAHTAAAGSRARAGTALAPSALHALQGSRPPSSASFASLLGKRPLASVLMHQPAADLAGGGGSGGAWSAAVRADVLALDLEELQVALGGENG